MSSASVVSDITSTDFCQLYALQRDELFACREALEKSRSRVEILEEELHGHRTSSSRPATTYASVGIGIMSSTPILLHDRTSPLSAAATSSSLQWLRHLRGAQIKAVQGCVELQEAAKRLVGSGESFASSLRELSAIYTSADASDPVDVDTAGNGNANTSSTIAAGAGMLAELLTEVCSFSANLAASLDTVFVLPLGGDGGVAFAQCMASVKAAGR